MRWRRRESEGAGLAFLDVISAGFGAIVLLLVIVKTAEPTLIKERGTGLEALSSELSARLPELDSRIQQRRAALESLDQGLAQARARLERLSAQQAAQADKALEAEAAEKAARRLAEAKQSLTEEMRRLLGENYRRRGDTVGGIPVDSEYIVFVIDTSGSMRRYAWNAMVETVAETLEIYPRVRGIQVMNDMGDYMFSQYTGQWIPDTPARRRAILERLRDWESFSNSSPVEGVTRAIRAFAAPDKQVSIYVLGDEYTGGAAQQVLDTVARLNPRDDRGRPRIRIHAIGFPTQLSNRGIGATGMRFAMLMRALTEANDGSFVALPR